jgi:hypothetical protein
MCPRLALSSGTSNLPSGPTPAGLLATRRMPAVGALHVAMDARVTLPTPVIQILVAMPFSPSSTMGTPRSPSPSSRRACRSSCCPSSISATQAQSSKTRDPFLQTGGAHAFATKGIVIRSPTQAACSVGGVVRPSARAGLEVDDGRSTGFSPSSTWPRARSTSVSRLDEHLRMCLDRAPVNRHAVVRSW